MAKDFKRPLYVPPTINQGFSDVDEVITSLEKDGGNLSLYREGSRILFGLMPEMNLYEDLQVQHRLRRERLLSAYAKINSLSS